MHICTDMVLLTLLLNIIIMYFSLLLTLLVDSTWSLNKCLRFQSTECWQTHTSRSGTARLCTEGLMSSFSVFSLTKTEPWAATSPCLHCFEGGRAQSVEGACCATKTCAVFHRCSLHMKKAFQ